MYLSRPLPTENDDHDKLVCLKKDEAIRLTSLYVSLIAFIIPRITKVQRKFGIPSKLSL